MKDLDHADWCLFTQVRLIESVNPEIICEIARYPDGKRLLFVSNVNEIDILKIHFLTNTDQNNNYLYMEDFGVFNTKNPSKPLSVPGLKNLMIELYRQADYQSYINGEKIHIGFTTQNFLFSNFKNNQPNSFNNEVYGSDINAFVDLYTSLIPFCSATKPGNKLYSFVLNPDNPFVGLGNSLSIGNEGPLKPKPNNGLAPQVSSSSNSSGGLINRSANVGEKTANLANRQNF